ncbi:DUF1127 domain-containing protein [Gymnodinialimonas ulvae]|uniref:DUF1127 domain-containing protein n=1 Tax=Gymnodinialimonas ulvae TaxID=3126504 RepID=UPI0030A556B2
MADLPLSLPNVTSSVPSAPKVRLSVFRRMIAVWRQRQHLNRLDAHMRCDVGLSGAEVRREVGRPIWDAPSAWRL